MHNVALVEWHDAVVAEIGIRAGDVTVRFSHLPLYERQQEQLYDIVSYAAKLHATSVVELQCQGALSDDAWVSEVRLNGAEAEAGDWAATTERLRSGGLFEFVFTNGSILSLRCAQLVLVLGDRKRVIEQWRGPL